MAKGDKKKKSKGYDDNLDFDGFDPDPDDTGIDHAERARRTGGDVDDPPADERAAVVDAAFD